MCIFQVQTQACFLQTPEILMASMVRSGRCCPQSFSRTAKAVLSASTKMSQWKPLLSLAEKRFLLHETGQNGMPSLKSLFLLKRAQKQIPVPALPPAQGVLAQLLTQLFVFQTSLVLVNMGRQNKARKPVLIRWPDSFFLCGHQKISVRSFPGLSNHL